MAKVYERIAELCDEKGVKAARMCREAGLSRNFMTELKSGRNNSIGTPTAMKLSAYFNVPIPYLMGETDTREPLVNCADDSIQEDPDELDIIRIYRMLDRRSKHEFMMMVYEYERRMELQGDNAESGPAVG